jgi:hypothetical protein
MLGMLHGLPLSSEVAEDDRYIHSVPHERKKLLKPFSFFGKSFIGQLIKCDCSGASCCDGCVMEKLPFETAM